MKEIEIIMKQIANLENKVLDKAQEKEKDITDVIEIAMIHEAIDRYRTVTSKVEKMVREYLESEE